MRYDAGGAADGLRGANGMVRAQCSKPTTITITHDTATPPSLLSYQVAMRRIAYDLTWTTQMRS